MDRPEPEVNLLNNDIDGILLTQDDSAVAALALEGLHLIGGRVQPSLLKEFLSNLAQKLLKEPNRDFLENAVLQALPSLEISRFPSIRFEISNELIAASKKNGDSQVKSIVNKGNANSIFYRLMSKQLDSTVALLALEAIYRTDSKEEKDQFPWKLQPESIRDFLREWRCKQPLTGAYQSAGAKLGILRNLTIFKALDVPLFIDNYGWKGLLSLYGDLKAIHIDPNTPIYHFTHSEEADGIMKDKAFKPSPKNMTEGCWFGIESSSNVFGYKAFHTTLSELGVAGLRQGEIVRYKYEINVILYAVDSSTKLYELKQPVVEEPKYVHISIFVPAKFLPKGQEFDKVLRGPFYVNHTGFCVKALRTGFKCPSFH